MRVVHVGQGLADHDVRDAGDGHDVPGACGVGVHALERVCVIAIHQGLGNQIGNLEPGQSRQSGNLNVARRCGFHDHLNDGNNALKGAITIQ